MSITKDQFANGAMKYEATYEALKLVERGRMMSALARVRWAIPDMTPERWKMTVAANEMGGLFACGKITPKGHEYYQTMIKGAREMAE